MIKAIAFDLVRVFIKVRDIKLNPTEKKLSETFDYKVGSQIYWNWAEDVTGLGRRQLEKISWDTINKLYEMREPDIFTKLPELKFATVSNHLSMIKGWLRKEGIYDNFFCHVVSEDIHCMKPSSKFYEVLIEKLKEKPEDILFVDDKEDNIEGAKKAGLKTLCYDGKKSLSESILGAINEE